MRKLVSVFLAVSLLAFAGSVPAHAAALESSGTPLRKLQRGFLNIALSPLEVVHALDKEKMKDDFIPSWVTGLGRGGLFMTGRALSGAYELVTFPIPFPRNYEPVVEPEFVWQHLDGISGYEDSRSR